MIETVLIAMMQPAEQVAIIPDRQALSLPNQIAPAVFPYLACMLQDRNSRLLGSRTGEAARRGIEQLKADCKSVRQMAEIRAREMLRNSEVSEASWEDVIAESLTSIDHCRDNIAVRLDEANPAQNQTVE